MPYVKPSNREGMPLDAGELTYVLTRVIDDYIRYEVRLNFQVIAEAVGALECAKLELYRRVAAPYEDRKMAENGDVYTCPTT